MDGRSGDLNGSIDATTGPTKGSSTFSKPDTGKKTNETQDTSQCKSEAVPVDQTLTCSVIEQQKPQTEAEKAKADSLDTPTRRYLKATIIGVLWCP